MDDLPAELCVLITDFLSILELLTLSSINPFFSIRKACKIQLIFNNKGTPSRHSRHLINKIGNIITSCVLTKISTVILPRFLKKLSADIKTLDPEDSFETYPNYLTQLEFLGSFNDRIYNLPSTIKYLKLCDSYNRTNSIWPLELRKLILGRNFDRNLDNLPSKLKFLKIKGKFNKSLLKLPDSLLTLILILECNTFIQLAFSPNLKKLVAKLPNLEIIRTENFNYIKLQDLPDSLEFLNVEFICPETHYILPKSINTWILPKNKINRNLLAYDNFNKVIRLEGNFHQNYSDSWNNINSAIIINGHNSDLSYFNFKQLKLVFKLNRTIENLSLPVKLEKLVIDRIYWIESEAFDLPTSLKYLKIYGSIPKINWSALINLKTVILRITRNNPSLCKKYIEDYPNLKLSKLRIFNSVDKLPPNIQYAHLLSNYQKLNFEIPCSLIHLKINSTIDISNVPNTVRFIELV